MEQKLQDGDYELIDGAAWFTLAGFSVRIRETDDGVSVSIYVQGRGYMNAITGAYAFKGDNPSPIARNATGPGCPSCGGPLEFLATGARVITGKDYACLACGKFSNLEAE